MTRLPLRIAAIATVPALLVTVSACSSGSGTSNGTSATPINTSASASASPSQTTASGGATATPAGCAVPNPPVTYKTTSLTAKDVKVTGVGVNLAAVFPFPACAAELSSKDLVVGTAAEAKAGSTISANYYLASGLTGQKIESSYGAAPFTAPLTDGSLIPGWVKGIPGMKVGGQRVLVIPGNLAYGSHGNGQIIGNETLVFVIELLAVK
ncbi:MAG: FKBP-type peptidyl-prolyl cis-trans isomerase [Actinomycetes bacterium]